MSGKRDYRVLLADQRWIRWTWRLSATSLGLLACLAGIETLASGPTLGRLVALVLTGLTGAGLIAHRGAVRGWTDRRIEQEASLTRILRGLSRSISPDAVVAAILDELRGAAGADHVAVARLLPGGSTVQATLVSSNAAVPVSVVSFPLPAPSAVRDSSGRVAVPVVAEGAGVVITFDDSPGRMVPERNSRAPGGPPALRPGVPGGRGRSAPGLVAATIGHPLSVTSPHGFGRSMPDGSTALEVAAHSAPSGAGRGLRQAVSGVEPAATAAHSVPSGAGRGLRRAVSGVEPAATAAHSVPSGAGRGLRRAAAEPSTDAPSDTRGRMLARRIADRVRVAYGLQHLLSVPLVSDAGVVGALILSRRREEAWSVEAQRLLDDAAQEVAAALTRAYAHEEAEARATLDALTGLPNRRYFDELAGILGRDRRTTDSPGVLMIDIDHFKRFNDGYGHAAGDAVLRAVAQAIAGAVRAEDVPARYGGEEFVVVLRRASPEQVADVAERVRAAVKSIDLGPVGVVGRVSVSVGGAVGPGTPGELVRRADAALLDAKRLGRDRAVVA